MRARFATSAGLPLALAACLCSCVSSPASLKPVAVTDVETGCPAGRAAWKLEVLDRRADRRQSESVTELVAESVRRSFPACRWAEASADVPTISIELNTFAATFSDHEGVWDAAAIWTVRAREASGRSLTEFECEASVSRVNYRSSNNGKDMLGQVLEKVMKRAVTGLRAIPVS